MSSASDLCVLLLTIFAVGCNEVVEPINNVVHDIRQHWHGYIKIERLLGTRIPKGCCLMSACIRVIGYGQTKA